MIFLPPLCPSLVVSDVVAIEEVAEVVEEEDEDEVEDVVEDEDDDDEMESLEEVVSFLLGDFFNNSDLACKSANCPRNVSNVMPLYLTDVHPLSPFFIWHI